MISLSLVALGLSSYFFLYCFHQVYLHPLSSYPGPLLAKLTNFWRLTIFISGRSHLVDSSLHKKYGTIVRDGPNSLLIADIEAFKTIYGFPSNNNSSNNRSVVIEKGDFYLSASNFELERPNVFAARTEKKHTEARKKLVSTAFAPKHTVEYGKSITKNVDHFMQKLQETIDHTTGEDEEYINIAPGLERFVFDTILEVAYGSSMGLIPAGHDKFGVLAAKEAIWLPSIGISQVPWLSRLFATNVINSFLRKPTFDKNGEAVGLTAATMWSDAIVDKNLVLSKERKGDIDLQPCVLRNLLTVEENDSRRASPEIIRFECMNTMFAGTGSTTAALVVILYELGTHLEHQSALHASLLSPITNSSNSPNQNSGSNVPDHLLQAIIEESLRLHPPFPSTFERILGATSNPSPTNNPRNTPKDIIPNTNNPFPTALPAGTRLWSNISTICRTPQIFGPDADEWRPERWLASNHSNKLREMGDLFCPFGRGSRSCIGKDIAWTILEKLISAIIQKYEIKCKHLELHGVNMFEMRYAELAVSLVLRT